MSKNEISSRSKILELEKALLNNVDEKNIIGSVSKEEVANILRKY